MKPALAAIACVIAAAAPAVAEDAVKQLVIPRPQPALAVRVQVAPAELGDAIARHVPALLRHAARQRAGLAGPPFVRYHARAGGAVDVDIGLPVDRAVAGDAERGIAAIELPAGPAIAVDHVGSFDRLPRAHAALAQWARARGHAVAGPAWEIYLTDPRTEKDPARWRARVFLPLTEEVEP